MSRVLLIEDDATAREHAESALTRGGFDVLPLADAETAMRVLSAPHAPRLVVTNWQLPGADGIELVQWLRARPGGDAHWVLMVSARESRDDEITALDAGADAYMTKPVDAARLRAYVRSAARLMECVHRLEALCDLASESSALRRPSPPRP